MNKSLLRALALLFSFALVAAACGDDDDTTTTDTTVAGDDGDGSSDGDAMGDEDFTACQVTDTGGVDDKSFNETAYKGLLDAADTIGYEPSVLESQDASDFEPNIAAHETAGCDIIVTVGFLLGDATRAAAEANPEQLFAIVDVDFADFDENGDFVGDVVLPNVSELTFSTDQAAFLAGYLAAGMTETNKVGTYGGINIPPVTIFMQGFEAGIAHYNSVKGTEVELVGYSTADGDGLFTGDFEDQAKGRATTETLLDSGVDIIMPVAGPVGLGSVEALRDDDGGASLIWVDTDGCLSVPDACDLFLTSVKKNMDLAVEEAVTAAWDGTFEGGLYTGTLENNGVDIAPYNDFEDAVPEELKAEIEALRAEIIAGSLATTLAA